MTLALPRWARGQIPGHPVGRAVAASALVGWAGTGVWISASALFFTRLLGLTASQVGYGLAMGGVLGLLAMVPISSLVRRRHAGRVAAALQVVRGLSFLSFLLVDSVGGLYAALALVSVTDGPGKMFGQIVVGRFVPERERTPTMAAVQVATNIGVTLGALLGTVGLLRVDRAAFDAVVVFVAAAFFLSAWLLAHTTWRQSGVGAAEPAAGGRQSLGRRLRSLAPPLRDGRFAVLTAGNGLLSLHIPLIGVMTPLWLGHRTSVPPAVMGGLLLLNTVTVVLLQVPLGRRVVGVRGGVRAASAAGALQAAGCGLLSLAAFVPAGWAAASLAGAVLAFTLGEILQVTAGWTLSFAFAPEDHGQAVYLGFFGLGTEAVAVFGPAALVWLTTAFGAPGFAVAAVVLAAAALLVRAACAPVRTRVSPGRRDGPAEPAVLSVPGAPNGSTPGQRGC
ncbi:MFS transporter [Streptomyces polygonati]|uniref:MFS transporter n=1 Tax=Streptomyces polygonati TaxID=1617087 RepID=A0ABV8HK17_9ACTN